MRKFMLSFFLLFSILATRAQELQLSAELGNPSKVINNGFIELQVSGGTPPYTYKWSDQKTSLASHRAEGLTEGIDYVVSVTDSEGRSTTQSFRVKSEAITEHFNGTFVPLVESMEAFLFWDPFSAVGIYDPKVYNEHKNVPVPGWVSGIEDKFVLKEWKVEEGSLVQEGDLIALVSSTQRGEIEVRADAEGKLHHLSPEGGVIYDAENQEDVIEVGAHNLASIEYKTPLLMTHPNGDPLTHNIPFIVIWLILGAAFFTVKMGFINFTGVRHSLQLASGKFDDPDAPGKINHFQTMSTAVSATVGLGNIAGVAVAISLGGAGATFWMILAGILGMSAKFVECSLGLKYRFINKEGRIFGGPMN